MTPSVKRYPTWGKAGEGKMTQTYPAGFAFASVDELTDLVDALQLATDWLNESSEMDDDYTEDDRLAMRAKEARLDVLARRFTIALEGAKAGATHAMD